MQRSTGELMSNFKTLIRWTPLVGAASLALAMTGCGGSSPQVTNFSEATCQNGVALAVDAAAAYTQRNCPAVGGGKFVG